MEPPEQPAAMYIGNNDVRGGNLTGIKHHPGNSYYTKLIKAAAAAIARLTGDGVSHEPPTATSTKSEISLESSNSLTKWVGLIKLVTIYEFHSFPHDSCSFWIEFASLCTCFFQCITLLPTMQMPIIVMTAAYTQKTYDDALSMTRLSFDSIIWGPMDRHHIFLS